MEGLSTTIIFGNSIIAYLTAFVVMLVIWIAFLLLQRIVIVRIKAWTRHTVSDIDDALVGMIQNIPTWVVVFASFSFATKTLALPPFILSTLNTLALIAIAYALVRSIQHIIDYLVKRQVRKEEDAGAEAAWGYVAMLAKIALWVLAALVVLATMGFNVTSILAGLGVVGVAVGFALQKILSDLFSSFAIYFDKPFQVGDLITVGEHSGTVERIGIKTTRLRTLQGEELVVSNEEMTSARVQNFRKLAERRVEFHFGILYETPFKKVQKVPAMVEEIISSIDTVRFDRVHFAALGDSALDFEVVYHVLSKSYIAKMNAQHTINMALMERFSKEKIGFAYPTHTVHMAK